MKHLRRDYDVIQDPGHEGRSTIADDEPVFILRAQDKVAAAVVKDWARRARGIGADPSLCAHVKDFGDYMDVWRANHGGGKVPDVDPSLLREPPQ